MNQVARGAVLEHVAGVGDGVHRPAWSPVMDGCHRVVRGYVVEPFTLPQAPHGSAEATWKIVASGALAREVSRTARVFATSGSAS